MRHTLYIIATLWAAICIFPACSGSSSGKGEKAITTATNATSSECLNFSADSAYKSIVVQCDMGPRVPGSEASARCAKWIAERFGTYGGSVSFHKTSVVTWDGTSVPCTNIVASIFPQASRRILLCAHWDSRPWADNDADETNHHTPVLGANDGASGVAVMLEIARLLQQSPLKNVGVDFVCFDVEDMGTPGWAEPTDPEQETWCLGSKAWCEEMARIGYKAQFGILLDMVGGRGASFAREQVSMHFASDIVTRVWKMAQHRGYGQFFPSTKGGMLIDDHVNVNTIADIPCIDIVPHHTDGPSSFGPTWHTIYDTPENIDPVVLKAVGETILYVLLEEDGQ